MRCMAASSRPRANWCITFLANGTKPSSVVTPHLRGVYGGQVRPRMAGCVFNENFNMTYIAGEMYLLSGNFKMTSAYCW